METRVPALPDFKTRVILRLLILTKACDRQTDGQTDTLPMAERDKTVLLTYFSDTCVT